MLKINILHVLYIITTMLGANIQAADYDKSDFNDMVSSLRECIVKDMVKDEKSALQNFHKDLQTQESLIRILKTYPKIYKGACKAKESIDRERIILKYFQAEKEHNNDMYTLKLTSNKAFAWSMRYKHISVLVKSNSQEQLNEAEDILKKWQTNDDQEIKLLTELFAQKLQNKKWMNECRLFKTNMYDLAQECTSFYNQNTNYHKKNNPFIYFTRIYPTVMCISTYFSSGLNAKDDSNAHKKVEDLCKIYENSLYIKTIFEQLEKRIKSLDAQAERKNNHNDFLPDYLKNNAQKPTSPQSNKHPQQKKQSKSRNKKKNKTPAAQDALSKESNALSPKVYPLSSSIMEEDDTHVTIKDNQNNVLITLWKVAEPQQTYNKPTYTTWVHEWFSDPEQAMEDQGYNNPDNAAKYNLRGSAQLVHSFSRVADQYINQCGIESNIINNKNKQHIAITMPGYITYPNDIEHHGLFTYFIDNDNGEWYHRNFTEKTREEIYAEYMSAGLYDVVFPELGRSATETP